MDSVLCIVGGEDVTREESAERGREDVAKEEFLGCHCVGGCGCVERDDGAVGVAGAFAEGGRC